MSGTGSTDLTETVIVMPPENVKKEQQAQTTNETICTIIQPSKENETDNNDKKETLSNSPPKIELDAQFPSFLALRNSLEKYQKEKHVQLIVKDSKLLSSESTKKSLPKVYHLINQSLIYYSITYCCKFHGQLKQKPGSRKKKVGAKRLNCRMYLRFKLSMDLKYLVLFDMFEEHSHPTDSTIISQYPRQQVYRLSCLERGEPDPGDFKRNVKLPSKRSLTAGTSLDSSITETGDEPRTKVFHCDHLRMESIQFKAYEEDISDCNEIDNDNKQDGEEQKQNSDFNEEDENEREVFYLDDIDLPLDPDSSCSDSDEEEIHRHRELLPFPIRLIGSAIKCSPELLAMTKELIQTQKENLLIANRKILLETKMLELQNRKLMLEVKNLEKSMKVDCDQATYFIRS